MSVHEWAERCRREDDGLGVLFGRLLRYGVHPDRAGELAEDAFQEALVRVIEQYSATPRRFERYEHFWHTVARIASNLLAEDARRDNRRQTRSLADVPEPAARDEPASARDVGAVIAALPSEDATLFHLKFNEGMTLDELADRLLPPDEGTPNARRLKIYRRLESLLGRLRKALSNDA